MQVSPSIADRCMQDSSLTGVIAECVCPGVPGAVVSMSTQYSRDSKQVRLLVLCAGEKDTSQSCGEGSLLTLLTLPVQKLTGTERAAQSLLLPWGPSLGYVEFHHLVCQFSRYSQFLLPFS